MDWFNLDCSCYETFSRIDWFIVSIFWKFSKVDILQGPLKSKYKTENAEWAPPTMHILQFPFEFLIYFTNSLKPSNFNTSSELNISALSLIWYFYRVFSPIICSAPVAKTKFFEMNIIFCCYWVFLKYLNVSVCQYIFPSSVLC